MCFQHTRMVEPDGESNGELAENEGQLGPTYLPVVVDTSGRLTEPTLVNIAGPDDDDDDTNRPHMPIFDQTTVRS